MEHLKEWNIFRKKKKDTFGLEELEELEEYRGIKENDLVIVNEGGTERPRYIDIVIKVVGIYKDSYGYVSMSCVLPDDETYDFSVDAGNVVKKLTNDEVEKYWMEKETDKYNF